MAGVDEGHLGIQFDPAARSSESKAYAAVGRAGDYNAYVWDWGGDPDPDFMLSVFTTDQCLGWSDGCSHSDSYDKLYSLSRRLRPCGSQGRSIDDGAASSPRRSQRWSWSTREYLQAYRTDTFTGYVPSPNTARLALFGWGPSSYFNLEDGERRAGRNHGGAVARSHRGLGRGRCGVLLIGWSCDVAAQDLDDQV